jgi:ABC-type multidrug transport system fused ATPase/permease subunit
LICLGNLELEDDVVISTIISLRDSIRKPEEIVKDQIDDALDFLKEKDVSEFIESHKYLKNNLNQSKEEKVALLAEMKDINLELRAKNSEITEEHKAKLLILKDQLKDKRSILSMLMNKNDEIEDSAQNRYNWIKYTIVFTIVFYYIGFLILIYKLGWDEMEQWTWIIPTLPVIIFLILQIIYEKSINILGLLNKMKSHVLDGKMKKLKFKLEEISSKRSEINLIQKRIESLENK